MAWYLFKHKDIFAFTLIIVLHVFQPTSDHPPPSRADV